MQFFRYRDHGQHQPEALLSRHRHPAVGGRSGCRLSWTSQMAQFSNCRLTNLSLKSQSFMVWLQSSSGNALLFPWIFIFFWCDVSFDKVTRMFHLILSFFPFRYRMMADMLFCPSLKAVNLLTSSGTVTCSSSQTESPVCMNVWVSGWVLSWYWFQPSCPLGLLPWVKLVDNFEAQYSYITNEGTVFTFHSNLEAPRYRVINIDIQKPERQHWTTIIPQHDKDVMGETTHTFLFKEIKGCPLCYHCNCVHTLQSFIEGYENSSIAMATVVHAKL